MTEAKFGIGDKVTIGWAKVTGPVQDARYDEYAELWKYRVNFRWYNESGVEESK